MIRQFSILETKPKHQRRTASPMPEGFKVDPTLNEHYPDALFSEKHAQAAENFKKFTLSEDLPKKEILGDVTK